MGISVKELSKERRAELYSFVRCSDMSAVELLDEVQVQGIDWSVDGIVSHARRHGYTIPSTPKIAKSSVNEEKIPLEKIEIGWARPNKGTKPTHLIIPDTQCKPGVPLDHLLWAGRYIAEKKPDVVIHLGDHWDFPSLSSYEKPGSHYFEGKRLIGDIQAGNQGLQLLMNGMGSFRPKRLVMLRGNHEDRLTRAINENPTLLAGLVGFENFNDVALGWEVIDYLTPINIDGIFYAHYFYNPNTGRAYAGSVDNMLRTIGHSFTMGHQQGKRMGSRELGNGESQRGLVTGSYYIHNEDFKGPQGNAHWRGLVVCHEVGNGTYDLMEVSMDFLYRRFGTDEYQYLA